MTRAVLILLFFANLAYADARQIDDYQWEGVERVVAIGDIHGDYAHYMATLKAAGLVNQKGKWSGGKTHLVHTGDVPDRGPDTMKILEHLAKLQKQARRKGGRVHTLIGNHEAMNVYGDLRYVHEGEFAAFKTRNSEALRDRVFEVHMQNLEARDPERVANLPADFRDQWNEQHPLGWVEHRQAWDPAWNPDAEYAQWVLGNKVAIRVNDSVFLHGGISGFYCQNSLASLTENVHEELREFNPQEKGFMLDPYGPLWYRGLSGVEPEADPETVTAILAQHGANRIVVGHTPTSGVVWPLYDSRVVVVDTGMAAYYGGYVAYLEITADGLFAGYPDGKLPLPKTDQERVPYLEKVIAIDPSNRYLQKRLKDLTQRAVEEPVAEAADGGSESAAGENQPEARQIPICGISR